MQTKHPCLDCMFNQGERTAKRLFGEGPKYYEVVRSLRELVDRQPPEGPPPVFYSQIYRLVSDEAEEPDPFKHIKFQNTQAALKLYPYLKNLVAESPDPLETAALIAITGNIIDHGANPTFDPERELELTLSIEPKVLDYAKFKNAVAHARHILYLGDNAGETVYDRVLIETIDKPTTFAVRPHPIINDATVEDAIQAGIDQFAEIVSTGSDMPGIDLNQTSVEFAELFETSDMVISKGMGNFETLSDVERPIFFLLKAKCDLVAEHIGVQVGDSVLYASNVS
jgi:uncharacterized protein with ATP-grasp and redox domains